MNTTAWGWRNEPSPLSAAAEEDVWFFSDYEEKTTGADNAPFCQLTRSEIAQKLLEDIENIVKRDYDDTFSDWLEQKLDLPIFDEIQTFLSAEESKASVGDVADFDCVPQHGEDLTPPISPEERPNESPLLLNLDDITPSQLSDEGLINFDVESLGSFAAAPENPVVVPDSNAPHDVIAPLVLSQDGSSTLNPVLITDDTSVVDVGFLVGPPTPIVDHTVEMAIVDEVIKNTAEAIEGNLYPESEASTSQSSSSESASGLDSPRSSAEENDDPEWMPLMKKVPKNGKRWKPYAREFNQEDRKLRKKEQNKNAATRYRQKKKAELSEILEEEKALEEKKKALEQKVTDIRLEIKYLKSLMRDLFKAKGLLV